MHGRWGSVHQYPTYFPENIKSNVCLNLGEMLTGQGFSTNYHREFRHFPMIRGVHE